MLSVALIGPDGAGKTTICQKIVETLPIPAKYMYMGVNLGSSNLLLPSSRLIVGIRRSRRKDSNGAKDQAAGQGKPGRNTFWRLLAPLRPYLRLLNLIAEECFRYWLVWRYRRKGHLVLLDRWFFADYHAYERRDRKKPPLHERIHRFMLERVYPKPDLVVYLQAPPAVLLARKGEGTLESIAQSHHKYLSLRDKVQNFFIVDANRATPQVVSDVYTLILDCHKARINKNGVTENHLQTIHS